MSQPLSLRSENNSWRAHCACTNRQTETDTYFINLNGLPDLFLAFHRSRTDPSIHQRLEPSIHFQNVETTTNPEWRNSITSTTSSYVSHDLPPGSHDLPPGPHDLPLVSHNLPPGSHDLPPRNPHFSSTCGVKAFICLKMRYISKQMVSSLP